MALKLIQGKQINVNLTGSFTGSFSGDGSQLTGIVSSKWTGSNEISRLGDVAVTGSFTNGKDLLASGIYSHAEGIGTLIADGGYILTKDVYHISFVDTGLELELTSSITSSTIVAAGNTTGVLTSFPYTPASVQFDYFLDADFTYFPQIVVLSEAYIPSTDQTIYQTTGLNTWYASITQVGVNKAQGFASHVEGGANLASGIYAHAEGNQVTASGYSSHAEGESTKAKGYGSHAEGYFTVASGFISHAEGTYTSASGFAAHAEGFGTVALGDYQHVQGIYNITSSAPSAFIIGNGAAGSRSNLVFASGSTFKVTGSIIATQGITGSLFGTASFAVSSSRAVTSSFAISSSFATTSSFAVSSSRAVTSSFAISASQAQNAVSASYSISSSLATTTTSINGFSAATIQHINVGETNAGTYAYIIRAQELEQSKYSTINIYNNLNFI